MEVTCETCGKPIYIPRPAMYVYRRRKTYKHHERTYWFCGWNCTVAFDKKSGKRG